MAKLRNCRNVLRYEHHHFRGWVVALKRGGKVLDVQYFKDGRGGPEASRRRAIRYRDQAVRRLPPPVKLKSRYSRNTTGVIGVSLTKQRTRAGNLVSYYAATWREEGRQRKRVFSLSKYGKQQAFGLAVDARREAVERVLANWRPGPEYEEPRGR